MGEAIAQIIGSSPLFLRTLIAPTIEFKNNVVLPKESPKVVGSLLIQGVNGTEEYWNGV